MLETYFFIECPGWHDEDGVFTYKVLHGEKLLQHGQDATLSPLLLPPGPAQDNYTYNLTVRIFDKYNSFSEETLLVTVSSVFYWSFIVRKKDGIKKRPRQLFCSLEYLFKIVDVHF